MRSLIIIMAASLLFGSAAQAEQLKGCPDNAEAAEAFVGKLKSAGKSSDCGLSIFCTNHFDVYTGLKAKVLGKKVERVRHQKSYGYSMIAFEFGAVPLAAFAGKGIPEKCSADGKRCTDIAPDRIVTLEGIDYSLTLTRTISAEKPYQTLLTCSYGKYRQ